MQLVVARVAAAAAVASEESTQTSLEAARQSAEDRATTAQTAVAAAATERDSLASRLALTEAVVENLRATAASAKVVAKRTRTTAATTKTIARDATQAATRKKATLAVRVSELERDLGTATTDLVTASCQFAQVTNQLQVVSEETMRLRENNAKLSQDLEGEPRGCFLSLSSLAAHFLSCSDLLVLVVGARVIHTGMTAKLAEQKQELNVTLLKVIEKDGAIRRLLEQLQSKYQTLSLSSTFPQTRHNLSFCSSFRGQDRAGAVADDSGAGCDHPEPSPGCPAKVGGHPPEGHRGHSLARESDEHVYGQTRRDAWTNDA
jgi:hypothetical protein